MKRIGILTSGGDCQGLNSTIRAVAKTLYQNCGNDGVQIIGIIDGYRGLIYNETRMMKPDDFSGIVVRYMDQQQRLFGLRHCWRSHLHLVCYSMASNYC